MTITDSLLAIVAISVFGTFAAAFVYAVLTSGRNWWREIFSARVIPFLLMGLAIGAATLGIGITAKHISEESLQLAVADIESDCDDQLGLLLHADACTFAELLNKTNRVSRTALAQLADLLSVDEVTIVDTGGRIVETIAPGARAGDPFFTDECRQRPYRRLLTGHRTTVSQRFRPSTTVADRHVKYFAMALPHGGFLQIGYTWETFEREFPRFFLPMFERRQISESGFCVVVDPHGRVEVDIPNHPDTRGRTAAEIGITPQHLSRAGGSVFCAEILGTPCRCMFYAEPIAKRRIMAAVPLAEGQGRIWRLSGVIAFVLFALFCGFRLVLYKFRQQQARIDALRAKNEAQRAADMALARAIQHAELRTDGQTSEHYRIATRMDAAREVGGDFYDYYELPDGRLVVTIADVSGKGVPAAFFMMKARLTLKTCVLASADLAEAVTQANVQLAQNNPAEMFVTAWVGIYDAVTHTLDFVSAGHNPPLVWHTQGTVEWLAAPRAAALGVFERVRYRCARTTLAAGERLFLYTDGVTEAMNAQGDLFGNERLEHTLKATAEALVPAVSRDVETFVAGAEQSDDITMLELEIHELHR